MHVTVESNLSELSAICRRHRVTKLELFGSAARQRADASVGDLDFLVTFSRMQPGEHAECCLSLQRDLEDLFAMNVDLVEMELVTNPYLREAIERARVSVYDAA